MNIFKQLIKSLYSPKDIALFRFQGIGKTILYIFFLTLIAIIPNVSYFSSAIINGIEATQNTINEGIPEFEISNGELTSDQAEPITMEQDNFTIIFDSTGDITLDELEVSNGLALLKNDFVLVAGGNIDTYSYSLFTDMILTKKDISSLVKSMESLLPIILPILVLTIYIFTAGIKFLEVTILALFGLVLKNIMNLKLQYRHMWRMAAYSVTLPTIFFTIMAALQTPVPNGFLINWFVSTIILYLALKEIPKPKTN
ncbi:DUF1189 domain-containing protein [Cytobacillus sp. FJAT-54145]|uniref:DUF1189 domain-containing protein n=1 Tax=Cytobacillus spartinae TaxID=3299023 RepID=A0ABW6KIW0_9BACI